MKNALKVILAIATLAIFTSTNAATPAESKKPLKVLCIGNSFSICVLKEMPSVAANLDLPLDICSMYIGGCSLERHVNNIKAPEKNPYLITWSYVSCGKMEVPFLNAVQQIENKGYYSNIKKMLPADKWDIVTIQQVSHQSWVEESFEPDGTTLINTIKKLAPQAKIYVQQTWSYTPWDKRLAKWNIDQNQMFDKLELAYDKFAKSHNLEQIYTGKAVQRYRAELPVKYTEKSNDDDVVGVSTFKYLEDSKKWWPKGDVFHFNVKGEYFQALVWTARLFNADVTKCTYTPEYLKDRPECAILMRKIATELK